jgi:hypothetical protein
LKLIPLFFALKIIYQSLSIFTNHTNFYQSLSLFTNSKLINALRQKILMPIRSSLQAQASTGRPSGLIQRRSLLSMLPPPPQQQTSSATAAEAAANDALPLRRAIVHQQQQQLMRRWLAAAAVVPLARDSSDGGSTAAWPQQQQAANTQQQSSQRCSKRKTLVGLTAAVAPLVAAAAAAALSSTRFGIDPRGCSRRWGPQGRLASIFFGEGYYIFQYNSFGLLKCHLAHSVRLDGHSKTPFGRKKCRLVLLRGLLAIFFPAQSFSRVAQCNNPALPSITSVS